MKTGIRGPRGIRGRSETVKIPKELSSGREAGAMSKIPQELSEGEETFFLHCKARGLDPQREVELIPGRKWRFDFFFPERNLVVEIEGAIKFGKSRHSRGDGFEWDCRKYNAASLAGFKLLRFTTAMVKSAEAIDTVMEALR